MVSAIFNKRKQRKKILPHIATNWYLEKYAIAERFKLMDKRQIQFPIIGDNAVVPWRCVNSVGRSGGG